MVRAFGHQMTMQKQRSFHFRKVLEIPGRHIQSFISDHGNDEGSVNNRILPRSHEMKRVRDNPLENQIGLFPGPERSPRSGLDGGGVRSPYPQTKPQTDLEMMKERFAKLLLGEDMSGGGKGVSSALALSNAITNLAASVFGEHRRLEPINSETRTRWRKEIEWLLSVTDHIVEFVPSQQVSKNGMSMEIMVTRQRTDLHMNIPALRKLDAMLIDVLDTFGEENEFWYVSRDSDEHEKGNTLRKNDKWWLPIVKVPQNGLSEEARRTLQFQKDSVNQVLKAAMAINAQVLSEMEIPESYVDSLPKNGRESLGDSVYKNITVEYFDPEQFLSTMDLSTEHKVLDLKNRIEASIIIWKRKMHNKDAKSPWGSAVSLEKRELFEERAETILLLLKQRFPGIPQSSLDISKIQYNKDVGQSILESYSRIIESLASTVLSRIEDVLHADCLAQNPSFSRGNRSQSMDASTAAEQVKSSSFGEDMDNLQFSETPNTKTLSDFIGWDPNQGATKIKKNSSLGNLEIYFKEENESIISKPPKVVTAKKGPYVEKLESLNDLRSPASRN